MYFSFWFLLFLVFYTYLGYGMLIALLARSKKNGANVPFPDVADPLLPSITLLVAAYNEADILHEKISNCLDLNYPAEKMTIAVVTDGSNDHSLTVLQAFPTVQVYHQPERRGKSAAINRVMPLISTEVVAFNDANTLLNPDALLLMARHYHDASVGGVSGEKVVLAQPGSGMAGAGEGLYWKYESLLKKLDSHYYSLIGAAGELFSIRTRLYEPIPDDTILDDFIISLRINEKGYRIVYEPEARASEQPSFDLGEEKKRKIRISAGGFQAISRLPGLLDASRHFKLTFMYLSHRVSRWTFAPLALLLLPFVNLWIVLRDLNPFYVFIFCCQLLFYAGAGLAGYFAQKNIKLKGLYVCYYFLFMNLSVFYGFIRFLKGNQSAVWEKARRGQAQ